MQPRIQRASLVSLAFAVLFIIIWHLLSNFMFNPMIVPPPKVVANTAYKMLASRELINHVLVSLGRVAVGFTVGAAVGVLLGIPMGRIRFVEAALSPAVQPARFLSPTAMIPIAIVWFGIGETSKYFLITYATVFIVMVNTMAGVRQTPPTRIRAAQCLGAKPIHIFMRVILPSALPYIIAGMQIALASAFMAIIPAEMLAAQSGLGYLLSQAGMLVQTDRIFVALAVISLLGYLTDALFRRFNQGLLARYIQEPLQ